MGSIGLRMIDSTPDNTSGGYLFQGGSVPEICYIQVTIPDPIRKGYLVETKPRRCVGKGTQGVSLRLPCLPGAVFYKESRTSMVTIGMNYNVLEGKAEVFERAFSSVLEAMTGIEGHSDSHLYRDVADEFNYLIVSEWSDEQAFSDFIKSDEFAKVTNWGKEQILAGPPKHQVYGA